MSEHLRERARLCAECRTHKAEPNVYKGREFASRWCATCKARLMEYTRGVKLERVDEERTRIAHATSA